MKHAIHVYGLIGNISGLLYSFIRRFFLVGSARSLGFEVYLIFPSILAGLGVLASILFYVSSRRYKELFLILTIVSSLNALFLIIESVYNITAVLNLAASAPTGAILESELLIMFSLIPSILYFFCTSLSIGSFYNQKKHSPKS